MITLSRNIGVLLLVPLVCAPHFVMAAQEEPELSSGALLEMQQQEESARLKWAERMEATSSFWADYMNNRKVATAYREQHALRREKRKEKRLQCRNDVRRANRDSLLSETMHCFRATLSMDLEILRKQLQYIESMVGASEKYRSDAVYHTQNLMDGISTVVAAIDTGVYTGKEELEEAKIHLEEHYRVHQRTSMAYLRVSHSQTWLTHLMVRLHDVLMMEKVYEEVVPKINESIACLEQKKELLEALFSVEAYSTLINQFRQVQSEVKFCNEMASTARKLNKELEQEEQEITE